MPSLMVDTHVHLHDCFPVSSFLDAALHNFRANHPGSDLTGTTCLLCLTDLAAQQNVFEDRLVREAGKSWSVTVEGLQAITTHTETGANIYLLGGRQWVASENLELLALGASDPVHDRRHNLNTLVDTALEAGALPVLPWGFGKWTGKRKQIVECLMKTRSDFFLADNGSRLRGTAEPELLSRGRKQGFTILTGSDPLPFPAQFRKAGANGVLFEDVPDLPPLEMFRKVLEEKQPFAQFGMLASLPEFLMSQTRMQIQKRRK